MLVSVTSQSLSSGDRGQVGTLKSLILAFERDEITQRQPKIFDLNAVRPSA